MQSVTLDELAIPRWVPIGLGEVGVRELPGEASNPRIEEYHSATRAGAAPDGLAWCSSWLCWVMERAGIASTKSKAASSWLTWGQPCKRGIGCVVVFGKSDPDAKGTGHVGISLGVCGSEVYVLGGNQRNAVNIATRNVKDVIAWRWPLDIQVPQPLVIRG